MPRNKPEAPKNNLYEMDDIIDYKREKNMDYFLIKWTGYSVAEASWEPRANVSFPDEKLKKRMESLKSQWRIDKNIHPKVNTKREKRKTIDSDVLDQQEDSSGERKSVTTIAQAQDASPEKSERESEEEPPAEKFRKIDESVAAADNSDNENRAPEEPLSQNKESNSENSNGIRVVHVRQQKDSLQACIGCNSSTDGAPERVWIDIYEARNLYPQALLDYLLCRLRFRKPAHH